MKRPRGQKYKWQPKIRVTTVDNHQGAKLIITGHGGKYLGQHRTKQEAHSSDACIELSRQQQTKLSLNRALLVEFGWPRTPADQQHHHHSTSPS
jgi:hypothetical protein